jgi:RNA polymerase sigma factor (sigma-70 family)
MSGVPLADIEALYRSSVHRFRGVAAAIVRDRETACDIVQDVFAAAVRKRAGYRGDGPLEAWLWRSVVNASLSHARRARPPLAAGEPREEAGSPDEAVQEAVAALPERQRLAVFLRYYADLDYRAIGDLLGISDGTARASVHAAHATLRRTLEVAL